MTADDNENQPRELKLGTHITLRVWMKITFTFLITAVISCQQLLTADDSCHEKN